MKYRDLQERLVHNSVLDLATECWVWVGFRDRKGYGMTTIWVTGRRVSRYAHRLAYEELRGPVPPGYQVDHKCRNPSCINPQHLQAVPAKVNRFLQHARKLA